MRDKGAPIVVKADGLAAGKGVVVAKTLAEAEAAIESMFAGGFGAAGAEVVVEEFLDGEEASFFALCDGDARAAVRLRAGPQARRRRRQGPQYRRHGRLFAGAGHDAGDERAGHARDRRADRRGMAKRGTPFRGVLFAGLMIGADGPKLIEYNVRFGDPEAEAMLARLDDDLLEFLLGCAEAPCRAARRSSPTRPR